MLHADIVYVLNATRLPGLSDECEKVERVSVLVCGKRNGRKTGRLRGRLRARESAHNYLTMGVVQL